MTKESTKIKNLAKHLAEQFDLDYSDLSNSEKTKFTVAAILTYLDKRAQEEKFQMPEHIDLTSEGLYHKA